MQPQIERRPLLPKGVSHQPSQQIVSLRQIGVQPR
jgi:hypothetical protein